MATVKTTHVQTNHPDYDKYKDIWKKMRDVIAGEEAVKEGGRTYLPPLNVDEDDDTYNIYLSNASFYNATGLTFEAFMGMIFRKPIEIGEDTDAALENPLFQNVDLEGTGADLFARDITEEVGTVGRVGILYDFPTAPVDEDGELMELSIAQAEQVGLRPYLKMYTAENIVNWKYKTINGVQILIDRDWETI